MSKQFDWNAIRDDYEHGMSFRALANKHDVSLSYIVEKRNKEGWNRPSTDRTNTERTPNERTVPSPLRFPMPDDAISIARVGLSQLAQHLQTDEILPIRDHKSLSDALAQYLKVLMTAPKEEESQEQSDGIFIPLNKLSEEARAKIRLVLAEDQQSRERAG